MTVGDEELVERFRRGGQLAADDPSTALAEARQAQQLSESAFALGREDFETDFPYGGWGGRSRGGVFPIPFPFPTGGWGGGGGWNGTGG